LPTTIRVDQGSQFTSKELDLWDHANGITLDFTDNAYVPSFNATVRLECIRPARSTLASKFTIRNAIPRANSLTDGRNAEIGLEPCLSYSY
jgi:transposase InsO family protein